MGSSCTSVNEQRDNRRRLVQQRNAGSNQNGGTQQVQYNQLPNSRMHEYNASVKEFMKQQEFKALAREK